MVWFVFVTDRVVLYGMVWYGMCLSQVEWYFPGSKADLSIVSYTVTYYVLGQEDMVFNHTQPMAALTAYTIMDSEATPVKPYTTYVVTVWADYRSGERVPSENVTVVTSEDVPGVPEKVTGDVLNNTAVLVKWEVRLYTCTTHGRGISYLYHGVYMNIWYMSCSVVAMA